MRRSGLYIGLIIIILISIWCVAAWYLSRSYYLTRLNEQVQDITKLSQIRAEDLADSIKRNLNYQRGIPDFFIHAVRVQKSLLHNEANGTSSGLSYETRKKHWIADPVLNDLDRTLAIASASFHVDLIHVENAAGDSIAASNWNTPASTIGNNYSEREYFQIAKGGQHSVQYAVGKTTHIAGLFFCSPVFIKGQFMGAVVSKINIPNLTFLIRQTDAFVADSNGIIILTHDQDKEMFSVPGSRVSKISSSERENLYQRDHFPELQMKPWGDRDIPSLLRVHGENYPQVIASKQLAEYGLTIYVEGDLPTYFDRKRDQQVMFALLATLGGLFGIGALGGLNYVSAMRRANERLSKSEMRYKTLEAATFEGIIITSEGRIVDANGQLTQMLGYERNELIGLSTTDIIAPENIDRVMSNIQKGVESHIEHEMLRKDGSRIVVEAHGQTIKQDSVRMRLTAIRDITERKKAEAELRIAATAFESQESLMITDPQGVILRVNKAFTEDTGYTADEIVGKTPRQLKSGRHDAFFYRAMWESINSTGKWQGEIWDRRKNGEIYPKWLSISAVKGTDSITTHFVGSHVDITERKTAEEKIQLLAFYDPLTGLPNRTLLMDRIKQALVSTARNGREGALLFLDLDNFKNLNDTLGHHIGDLLLQQVAQRLESCTREGDTVARLGGDEFLVMLVDLSSDALEAAGQTESIGEKILAALSQPYQLEKNTYRCSASIGVTLFNGKQEVADELLKHADIAMYQAKKAGRNTLRFFDLQMQQNIFARVSLEGELQNALEFNQFHLHYQIQVDHMGHPIGAEALIRWIHPERGLVSPAHFIPLAEETGLILPVGDWVLGTACAQLKAWQGQAHTQNLVLAINVSARQFHQLDFAAHVHAAVQKHAINPRLLKLELTESMLLDDIQDTIATMNSLKKIGIQFSLDDFGTGYSSLQYLKKLPLDQIKIDQSFVHDIATDPNDAAIVQTIIAMAETLGFDVIAEGVETEAQREFLELRGCRAFQGYLLGRPLPIEQFEESLTKG